jgi:archaellum component FlaC
MAVKLHCAGCERFIKDLSEGEMKKSTGKEFCADCAAKMKKIFGDIDSADNRYKQQLNTLYGEVEKEYRKFQKFREQNLSQVTIILASIRKEIENMTKMIFKEKNE